MGKCLWYWGMDDRVITGNKDKRTVIMEEMRESEQE